MNGKRNRMLLLFLLLGAANALSAETLEERLAGAVDALHRGERAAAISTLENLDGNFGRWEVPFWLGTAYLLDGQLDNAALMLDDALAMESEVADVWVQRAVVAQERGAPQVALQFLEVAVQVDAGYPLAYLNAALAYESLGDTDNARGAYGRFLKLSSEREVSNRIRRLRRDVLNRIAAGG